MHAPLALAVPSSTLLVLVTMVASLDKPTIHQTRVKSIGAFAILALPLSTIPVELALAAFLLATFGHVRGGPAHMFVTGPGQTIAACPTRFAIGRPNLTLHTAFARPIRAHLAQAKT